MKTATHLTIFFLPLFCLATLQSAFSQGFLHAKGQQIVDGAGNPVLLRGIGLGGWMLQEGYMMLTSDVANTQYKLKNRIALAVGQDAADEFYEAWLENFITEQDMDSLKAWGFNSIRLPMHYNLFTLPVEKEPVAGQNTWLDKGFELTDRLLGWCAERDMYLILDLHAAPGGQGKDEPISDYDPSKPSLWESTANRNKTIALWKRIATRYAEERWIGGYDLLNEPNWSLPGNALLRELYQQITTAIRQVDTNHLLFIEGNWFANDFTGLTPPWDDNMAYSFHKYWSYNDQTTIQWVLDLRNQHQVPIWMGEAGENSDPWFTAAIQLLENFDIGWAWWPYKKLESIAGPLSVPVSGGYQALLDFWKGDGPPPAAGLARQGLLELAANLAFDKCVYHREVIDAMFRQRRTNETLPFRDHQIPGLIFATDFDLGKAGYAYRDKVVANFQVSSGRYTAWNEGWSYRNDGVDIEICTDRPVTNGYNVGWIEDGEWLQYTVRTTRTGSYRLTARLASALADAGRLKIQEDGQDISPSIPLTGAGGWQNWQSVVLGELPLNEGVHQIRLLAEKGGFNLNWLEFEQTTAAASIPVYPAVTLFPNPTTGFLFLETSQPLPDNLRLVVYNLLGQKILERHLPGGVGKQRVDLSDLGTGVYVVRVIAGKSSFTEFVQILN